MAHTFDVSTISAQGAIAVIDACIATAESLGVAIVAWVVDPGGNDVAMTRMDGSLLVSRQVAADKAWTSAALHVSTADWVDAVADEPVLAGLGANNRICVVPGGVPLHLEGALVGAVGVSGATAEQDHQIATAGADALSRHPNG